ncbi:helix-turn-helix domain-containing protein [Catenuloplanes sp. NPDC051500]|uniref:helix-turn-helix domain-containing protein n=1 Tax=Catenuloplanes sp. NPDC051500 TaxID=3363959 RepID=UPI0037A1E908
MSSLRGTTRVDTECRETPGDAGRRERISGCPPLLPGADVRGRDSRAWDVTVSDFHTVSGVRAEVSREGPGELRLYLVRQGAWTLRYDQAEFPLHAGRFLVKRSAGLHAFETAARTTARTVGLPLGAIDGPAGGAPITGPATAPEARLLLAHASLLHDTIDDLTDAGVDAARNALIELARGVVHRYVDGDEPALAPALAGAARALADRWLTRAGLTPTVLARELHVSVRTLSRAFAATGEPATAYIRRRRLEEARAALTGGRSVSEVAARWQFADSSHFIRAFRARYGRSPARYARDHQ